jgi:hypothetical protein
MHNVELRIDGTPHRHEGIAAMALFRDQERLCGLDIQYSLLRDLRNTQAVALDFVILASAVYALDKSMLRESETDGWARDFALTMPVSDPERWMDATPALTEAVNFLTGDRWEFRFTKRTGSLVFPQRRVRRRPRSALVPIQPSDCACLFSGGLDSLAGAMDHLAGSASKLLLIGHHDGDMAGPFADQRALIEPLRSAYPQRLRSIFLRVGQSPSGTEITLRSRSLLFIALGMYGASAVGPTVPLLMPENGTIALNFPLTPSRRGSCSTRTAHPYYLETVRRALVRLGIANPLINPLAGKTKGEVVEQCANPELLRRLAPLAVSCAKRGRKGHWRRTTARSCGQCMPCIYRRAAMHKVGADSEVYGSDVCTGEVAVFGDDDAGRDFRACLSLLRRRPSSTELANTLMACGPLDVRSLPQSASLVVRAMDEVRSLLRDKGTADVQRAAGMTARDA